MAPIFAVVFTVLAFLFHKSGKLKRILRPNRPFSTTGTFFQCKVLSNFFSDAGDAEVAARCGTYHAINIVVLKYLFLLYLITALIAAVMVPINATDNYFNQLQAESDPQECTTLLSKAACEASDKETYCQWNRIFCQVKERKGLFSLQASNLTPGKSKWRLIIMGICSFFFALAVGFIVHRLSRYFQSLAVKTYLGTLKEDWQDQTQEARRIQEVHQGYGPMMRQDGVKNPRTENLFYGEEYVELVHPQLRRGSLASAGARTVFISGINESLVPADLHAGRKAFLNSCNSAGLDTSSLIPDSIKFARVEPKKTVDLIEKEADLLDQLKDAVSQTQQEKDLKKLPVMKMSPGPCCKKEAIPATEAELAQVRSKLTERLQKAQTKKPQAVFASFDTPASAFQFVEEYNKAKCEFKGDAQIAGPKSRMIWPNVPASKGSRNVRWLLFGIIFIIFAIWVGTAIAFLGNIDNLGTLPSPVGTAFNAFTSNVPSVIRGNLQAYLPVIVISVFNAVILPLLVRLFAKLMGAQKGQLMDASVLNLYFVFVLLAGIILPAALTGGLSQLAIVIAKPNVDTVFQTILAIVSPNGGYFFTLIILGTGFGLFFRLSCIVKIIVKNILKKITKRQDGWSNVHAPDVIDMQVNMGQFLFIAAVGLIFHGQVPLLLPFLAIYFFVAYLVERSLTLDMRMPTQEHLVEMPTLSSILSIISNVHFLGCFGTVITLAFKYGWGGFAPALIGLIVSFFWTIKSRMDLTKVIRPSAAYIAELQQELPARAHMPHETTLWEINQGNAPVYPGGHPGNTDGTFDPFVLHNVRDLYAPPYQVHTIDEDAVPKIHNTQFAVDEAWIGEPAPQKDGELGTPRGQEPFAQSDK